MKDDQPVMGPDPPGGENPADASERGFVNIDMRLYVGGVTRTPDGIQEVEVVFQLVAFCILAMLIHFSVEQPRVPAVTGSDAHRDAGEPGQKREAEPRMSMEHDVKFMRPEGA